MRLKWPNDLWLQERKLGGILVETAGSGEGASAPRTVVIGVGINIARPDAASVQTAAPAPPGTPTAMPPAGLSEVRVGVTAGETLALVAPALVRDVLRFGNKGFAAFAQAFALRDALRGPRGAADRRHRGHCRGRGPAGRAAGADAAGPADRPQRGSECAPMLRIVALLLLLADGAYFAWTSGWLAGIGLPSAQQREPERLKAQIDPAALRLLNGERSEDPGAPAAKAPASQATDAAPAAAAPAQACWQAAGFTPPQAEALRSALGRIDLSSDQWQLNETRSSGRWVVFMGRYNDEQMTKKKTELRELKIEFREVNLPSTGPGLALGTFSSEEAVQQALKDVAKKGVRTRARGRRAPGNRDHDPCVCRPSPRPSASMSKVWVTPLQARSSKPANKKPL